MILSIGKYPTFVSEKSMRKKIKVYLFVVFILYNIIFTLLFVLSKETSSR